MLTTELNDHLLALRTGRCDSALAGFFERTSARSLIDELSVENPVVFQQRTHHTKTEIGLARESTRVGDRVSLLDCYLISAYDDAIGEVTWTAEIQIRPADNGWAVSLGRAHKLDKSPDGWSLKSFEPRETVLAAKLLKDRGWQFGE